MFHRRSIATALALLAGFGAPAIRIADRPPVSIGTEQRRQIPRRMFGRPAIRLPGKKGIPQKHQGKACRHRKHARARRRTARMRR